MQRLQLRRRCHCALNWHLARLRKVGWARKRPMIFGICRLRSSHSASSDWWLLMFRGLGQPHLVELVDGPHGQRHAKAQPPHRTAAPAAGITRSHGQLGKHTRMGQLVPRLGNQTHGRPPLKIKPLGYPMAKSRSCSKAGLRVRLIEMRISNFHEVHSSPRIMKVISR